MQLTNQDREKFMKWLEQSFLSDQQLIEQFEKLPTPAGIKQELLTRMKQDLTAKKLVFRILASTECQTIE